MGVQVTFDYAAWILLFPEFATTVSQPQAEGVLLPMTGSYLRNDGGGPVSTAAQQTNLLNLIMAHCAQLFYGSDPAFGGSKVNQLVGRINSASQGSVSVGVEMPQNPNDAWYNQTKYGSAFRAATAPYRTMRYLTPPRRNFNFWPGRR